MASKTETYYPPYTGAEPYIHLCFSDGDERKVRPLLRLLLLRGCRVWYCMGERADRTAQMQRNKQMLGAGLTVLFLTEAVRQDTELKNRLLVCQRAKQPILVLNTDGGDGGLSLGLTGEKGTVVRGGKASDACDTILHGEGFSQDFLGDPLPVHDRLWLRRVNVLLVVLSLLLATGVGVHTYLHPPEIPSEPNEGEVVATPEPTPEPVDEVLIEDEYLQEVARSAMGGGLITKAGLEGIETLRLDQLPESVEDLAVFPNLKTLILSQEAAQNAPQLPELYDSYTLIVGGDQP